MRHYSTMTPTLALAVLLAVSSCATTTAPVPHTKTVPTQTMARATPVAVVVAKPKPVITAIGFASVSGQMAKTLNERRILAVKAARLEAMRILTEQVFGLRINGDTLLSDAIVKNDNLRAVVTGKIRGARTVRITPKGDDTYEVALEVDIALVKKMMRSTWEES